MSNIILYNDDCLNIFKTIEDNSIDLIVTDPPYKTITGGDTNSEKYERPKGMLGGNRKLFKYQNNIKIVEWMPELFRILKNETHAYIFTNSLNLIEMLNTAIEVGFQLHNLLVWEKNNCTPSQFYMKNCEYVLFLRKGNAKWINNIGNSKTVHLFNNVVNKSHPTEKPVDLLKYYIANSSNDGDLVLDPFMGVGSTGVACKELNRNFIGIEIDKEYYDIAEGRINKTTVITNNKHKLF